jgi:cyclopropane fatty-acyl-phospholipid synthase-like methyltransferase
VVRVLAITPGMSVADLGTGTGYFLSRLSRAVGAGGTVLALDVEPDMIRYVRERVSREGLANVRAEVVAADDPKLPAGKVDRVLVVDTWHHISDRASYAAKLAAGLAPRGAVFVVDFTMDAKEGPPVHHRIRPEEVMDTLQKAGLRAELVAEDLPEQYVVAGRKP